MQQSDLGLHWLFAQTCLSKNLGSLQQFVTDIELIPACAGSCPEPPPQRRVTFPCRFTSTISARTTTLVSLISRNPGLTATRPSRFSSTQRSTVFISFFPDIIFQPVKRNKNEISHLMTKPTKWHVHPAKTQFSLGICRRSIGSLGTKKAHSEDWSDWADAQADLSLRWAHRSFFRFCREAAQIP